MLNQICYQHPIHWFIITSATVDVFCLRVAVLVVRVVFSHTSLAVSVPWADVYHPRGLH